MELAALDLARQVVHASRLGSRRPVLAHSVSGRFEEIRVRGHVDDGREAGMRDRAVVALEEVLGAELPVRLDLRLRALEEAKRVDVDSGRGDAVGHVFEEVRERAGIGVRAHEDEGAPGLRAQLQQAEVAGVDPAFAVRARRRDQSAVEPVRPRVVGALERRSPPGAFADDRASVPADVEERAELVLLVADEHHGDVSHARRTERAGLRDLVRPAGVLPEAAEDPLLLEPEGGGIDVPAPGKSPSRAPDGHVSTLPVACGAIGTVF